MRLHVELQLPALLSVPPLISVWAEFFLCPRNALLAGFPSALVWQDFVLTTLCDYYMDCTSASSTFSDMAWFMLQSPVQNCLVCALLPCPPIRTFALWDRSVGLWIGVKRLGQSRQACSAALHIVLMVSAATAAGASWFCFTCVPHT